MELTRKQEEGLKLAVERYRHKEKYTVISGYAGSGKSTLVRFIIDALASYGIKEEDVVFATFTGKAAQVLINKGNSNAMTLHKLLFKAVPLPSGKFKYIPKPSLGYKIVIVDEASMAPKNLINLLLSHNIYVIYLGDPFQLLPIYKEQAHNLLDHPHIFLDEIMRQAKDNEIIQLSMDIREGKPLKPFSGKQVKIFHKNQFEDNMLLWGDITICAKNKTREKLNKKHRSLLNYDPDNLNENDKIINLKNDWDIISHKGNALTNGAIGTLKHFNYYTENIKGRAPECPRQINSVKGNFITETGDDFGILTINSDLLLTGIDPFTPRQKYLLGQRDLLPLEMVYGYAITCWKAQGSEFNKVLGIEENFPFNRQEHAQYLYTLVTRAAEKLILIMQ